jgi:hypothetical protein
MNVMLLDTRANKSVQEYELIEATSNSNGTCRCSCSSSWSDIQSKNSNGMYYSNTLDNSSSV